MAALAEHLPTVPSVRRWLAGLRQALAERCSAIVVLPASLEPAGIWDALRLELERIRGEWPADLDVAELPQQGDMLATFAAAFGVDRRGGLTLESTLTAPELPDIITVRGIDGLASTARAEWLGFMSQASALSQALAGQRRVPSFLCLARGDAILGDLPATNLRLAVNWWWGMPSLIELRVLFRSVEDRSDRCREMWREHVLPSLAGADIELAEHLWDDGLFDGEDLLQRRLVEYAERSGWNAEFLKRLGLEARLPTRHFIASEPRRVPPPVLRLLWAHGLVNETDEHGIEISSAALAVLGRREELAHRVWRGQSGLLLPLLDSLRLHLCNILAAHHGPAWPTKLGLPLDESERQAVEEDPFAAQWGYLSALFRNVSALRARMQLRALTGQAWEIRNELAHYRPVLFAQFRRLWEHLAELAPTNAAGEQ